MTAVDVRDLVDGADPLTVVTAAEFLAANHGADVVDLALRCGRKYILPLEESRRDVSRLETLVVTLEETVALLREQVAGLEVTVRAQAAELEAARSELAGERVSAGLAWELRAVVEVDARLLERDFRLAVEDRERVEDAAYAAAVAAVTAAGAVS